MSETLFKEKEIEIPLQPVIIFLIPVYNDWKSLEKLIKLLDSEFTNNLQTFEILVIDDASTETFTEVNLSIDNFKVIKKISILELRRNLGHQRAIALGLTYIETNNICDIVVVMDGDGEDTVPEAKRLIEQCISEEYTKIVFGKRTKRSENLKFRLFYQFYKIIYRLLTGQNINFGNFSAIPAGSLNRLVHTIEIWNHYAAAVSKSKIPYKEIDTKRGVRLDGKSKMNFVSLVVHGLSAISVYGEVIGVRLFISTIFLTIISISLIAIVIGIRFLTNIAIPGWATYVSAFLIVILLQFITLSLFFSFLVLIGRNNTIFFPKNEYHNLIKQIVILVENKAVN